LGVKRIPVLRPYGHAAAHTRGSAAVVFQRATWRSRDFSGPFLPHNNRQLLLSPFLVYICYTGCNHFHVIVLKATNGAAMHRQRGETWAQRLSKFETAERAHAETSLMVSPRLYGLAANILSCISVIRIVLCGKRRTLRFTGQQVWPDAALAAIAVPADCPSRVSSGNADTRRGLIA
jgi:hypothetical protein